MSEVTFETLGNVWINTDPKVTGPIIHVKHFMKPITVRISYMKGGPNEYLVKFLKNKWSGNDLDRLMARAEEAIKHV